MRARSARGWRRSDGDGSRRRPRCCSSSFPRCCHPRGLLESLCLVLGRRVRSRVGSEPTAVPSGKGGSGDDDDDGRRSRCCRRRRSRSSEPAGRRNDAKASQAASRAPEAPDDDGSSSGDSSGSSSSNGDGSGNGSSSGSGSQTGNHIILVALPRQVRRIKDHAHGPVHVDVARVDPLLRPPGRGAHVPEQVSVDDVARRERHPAAVDRAPDHARALEVLDVAQAAQVAPLVVAEAVEAVDGVAVLEEGDPAAVEFLG